MPLSSTPALQPTPVRTNDGVRVTGVAVAAFQGVATHRIGVARFDPVATPAGTPFTFALPEVAANEWTAPAWDSSYVIDGNPNFVSQGGVATLIVNGTTVPNEDEFYFIGVERLSDNRVVDFVVVYKQKANLDIFDSTSDTVDEDLLDRALALAGHNVRYLLTSLSAGQPAEHVIRLFNTNMTNLSVDPDDINSVSGLNEALVFTTEIDSNGDIIRVSGGE